jgi:hypothetical protein
VHDDTRVFRALRGMANHGPLYHIIASASAAKDLANLNPMMKLPTIQNERHLPFRNILQMNDGFLDWFGLRESPSSRQLCQSSNGVCLQLGDNLGLFGNILVGPSFCLALNSFTDVL